MEELPSNPTVVEIGCGDGHFVRGLADSLDNRGSFIGFVSTSRIRPRYRILSSSL